MKLKKAEIVCRDAKLEMLLRLFKTSGVTKQKNKMSDTATC